MSQKTEMESLPAIVWIHRLCFWGWLVTGLMDWQLCPLRMLRDALWEVVLLVVLHATCCCLKRVSERKNRIKMTIYDIVITCHCIIVCVHNCTYMSIYTYIYTVYRPNHQTFNSHDSKSNIVIPAPSRTWRRITEPLLRRARSSCQGVTGSRSVKHGKIDFQNHGMLGWWLGFFWDSTLRVLTEEWQARPRLWQVHLHRTCDRVQWIKTIKIHL